METDAVFKAIADGTRRRALAVLRRHELTVSELVEVLGQPQSTVSRHLKVLREAALICDRRNGNTVLYAVSAFEGANGRSGKAATTTAQLVDLVSGQALDTSTGARLETVIRQRSHMSQRFFDRVGHHWDGLREASFGSRFHLEAFLSLLPESWTVADIGTGTGYLLPAVARHFQRVVAIDPVEKMLKAARRRIEHHGLANVDLRSGDLVDLPIKKASVDLALAVLVLHHVPIPKGAVAEMQRIVRPGGRVLIVEQSTHSSQQFLDRMQDRWWGFDPDELVGMLTAVGFDKAKTETLGTVDRAEDAPELFVVTGTKPK